MSTEITNPLVPELDGSSLRGAEDEVVRELYARFGTATCRFQPTRDGVPTVWVPKGKILEVLRFLKQLPKPFSMLYDLSAIDEQQIAVGERLRYQHRLGGGAWSAPTEQRSVLLSAVGAGEAPGFTRQS